MGVKATALKQHITYRSIFLTVLYSLSDIFFFENSFTKASRLLSYSIHFSTLLNDKISYEAYYGVFWL